MTIVLGWYNKSNKWPDELNAVFDATLNVRPEKRLSAEKLLELPWLKMAAASTPGWKTIRNVVRVMRLRRPSLSESLPLTDPIYRHLGLEGSSWGESSRDFEDDGLDDGPVYRTLPDLDFLDEDSAVNLAEGSGRGTAAPAGSGSAPDTRSGRYTRSFEAHSPVPTFDEPAFVKQKAERLDSDV